MEIRPRVSGRLREVKNIEKFIKPAAQKVFAVSYEKWSFTRGSKYRALTGEKFGVLDRWSIMRGGHTWSRFPLFEQYYAELDNNGQYTVLIPRRRYTPPYISTYTLCIVMSLI